MWRGYARMELHGTRLRLPEDSKPYPLRLKKCQASHARHNERMLIMRRRSASGATAARVASLSMGGRCRGVGWGPKKVPNSRIQKDRAARSPRHQRSCGATNQMHVEVYCSPSQTRPLFEATISPMSWPSFTFMGLGASCARSPLGTLYLRCAPCCGARTMSCGSAWSRRSVPRLRPPVRRRSRLARRWRLPQARRHRRIRIRIRHTPHRRGGRCGRRGGRRGHLVRC